MHEIATEVTIDAPSPAVWRVLMDFARYPEWNPFVREISGAAEVGQRLRVTLGPPGGKGMRFRPKVLVVEPNTEFHWIGRLLLPGIFDGRHYFRLRALDAQRPGSRR
jgi:uncharacterized protein YndB with AHSA1/START domain